MAPFSDEYLFVEIANKVRMSFCSPCKGKNVMENI